MVWPSIPTTIFELSSQCVLWFSKLEYDDEVNRLIITCPSDVHEMLSKFFGTAIEKHLTTFKLPSGAPWVCGGGTSLAFSRLEPSSKATPDFCVSYNVTTPFIVMEVAVSQSVEDARGKCLRWLDGCRKYIRGAIIVNLEEKSRWSQPSRAFKKMTMLEFENEAKKCNEGEAIEIQGHVWFHPVECKVTVMHVSNDIGMAHEEKTYVSDILYNLYSSCLLFHPTLIQIVCHTRHRGAFRPQRRFKLPHI